MKNILLLLICSFVLVGCDYRKETKRYGIYELTNYWRKDLLDSEGGNEGVYKQTLCNLKTSHCFEDSDINFLIPGIGQETWHLMPEQPWILLFDQPTKGKIQYVNATTGEEIQCTNCTKDVEVRFNHENGELLDYFWFHGAKRILIKSGPKDQSKVRLDYLEFQGDHVQFHPIVEYTTEGKPVMHFRMMDADFLAWTFCSEKCIASTFDFKTREAKQGVASCGREETIWVRNRNLQCVSIAGFKRLSDTDAQVQSLKK